MPKRFGSKSDDGMFWLTSSRWRGRFRAAVLGLRERDMRVHSVGQHCGHLCDAHSAGRADGGHGRGGEQCPIMGPADRQLCAHYGPVHHAGQALLYCLRAWKLCSKQRSLLELARLGTLKAEADDMDKGNGIWVVIPGRLCLATR
jgi:hypothetical protein